MNAFGDDAASDTRDRLAQRKKIDAICDRFETAWDAGREPRIEAYLAEATGVDAGELFRELLASELALRGTSDPQAIRDRYLARFPQFGDCVLGAFAMSPPKPSVGVNPPNDPQQRRLIEAVRRRLSFREGLTVVIDRESSASSPAVEPAVVRRLWDSLIRGAAAAESNRLSGIESAELEALDEVTSKLLSAFPSFRRKILLSLLLGETFERAALRHRCSERTILATCQAASDLLLRQAG